MVGQVILDIHKQMYLENQVKMVRQVLEMDQARYEEILTELKYEIVPRPEKKKKRSRAKKATS